MNIFHKVAWKNLLKNRTRTLVTVMGVILSTTLFTAVATFGTSLIDYLIRAEIAQGGNWHIQFSGVAPDQREAFLQGEEIAQAAVYENLGYARLEEVKEASEDKPYLFLAGLDQAAFETLPVQLISGKMPENDRELLIPDHLALKAGIRIRPGTEIFLEVGQRMAEGTVLTQCDPYEEGESLVDLTGKTYTVTGTYARPGFEVHTSPGYTLITRTDGEVGAGEDVPSASFTVLLTLKNPRHIQDYGESRKEAGAGPYEINEKLLRFMGITENRLFNTFLYTVGGVLAAIIMVGSVFLIYNSFHISLGERVHQLGILMSVGATAKQLRGTVVFEGLCIGGMGIPLGILTGIGSVRVLLPMVSQAFQGAFYEGVPLKLAVSWPALAAAAGISLVTILVSAYLPAKKAAAMPVMECIRQTGEIRVEARRIRTPGFVWKWYGLEGTLALKNFKRNRKRCRSIILSLTLSVVLAVAGSGFSTTLKRVGREILAQTADGDLLFSTQELPEDEFFRLYEQMKDAEGVTESTWQADPSYRCRTEDLPEDFLAEYRQAMGDGSTGPVQEFILDAQFIEDERYYDFVESLGLPREDFGGQQGKVLVCGINTRENAPLFVGNSLHLTLESSDGEGEKEVCAVFQESYPLDVGYIRDSGEVPAYSFLMTAPMSARSWFDPVRPADAVHLGATFWSKAPSRTLARLENLIQEETTMADYTLVDLSAAFGMFRNLNFVIDLFTSVFVVMLSLIAVANVFNTISTNFRLRRREFAMLRSVGMSDREFYRMIKFECAFYGIQTLLYSVPIATVLAWLIFQALVSIEELDHMAFVFPWAAMGTSVLGVFGVVFLTMVYAAGKIRKENIIDALRDDMT